MVNRRGFLKNLSAGGAGAILPSRLFASSPSRTLLRYPYIQDVRGTSAVILWTTLEDGAGLVVFTRDGKEYFYAPAKKRYFPTDETRLPNPFYQYRADLTNLLPDSNYQCQVLMDDLNLVEKDAVYFHTRPAGPFRFLAYGDSGMGTDGQLEVARLMGREAVDLVIHTGDIAYMNGTYEEFETRHFKYYWDQMRHVPYYPSFGNHEYYTDGGNPCLAVHAVPWELVPEEDRGRYYSFDWGNVHFIALDTNLPLEKATTDIRTGKMLDWLESDLQSTSQFWRIPFFHHPPFATGPNVNDPHSILVRRSVVPILDRHEVEAVFDGHEHSYQRSRPIRNNSLADAGVGTVYITTGGGGAWLYRVDPSALLATGESCYHYVRAEVNGYCMTLETIRSDGKIIDRAVLEPKPTLSSITRLSSLSSEPNAASELGDPIRIHGRHLAAMESAATAAPLPTRLSEVVVDRKGQALGLWKVSSREIIAVLPFGTTGDVEIRVTTPNGSATAVVEIPRRPGTRRR